ncbi:DUF2339 domain-containing protein [Pseudomonas sp. N040]|uniref:DUF2339 domain-containing protein n=1 Tax=Pseudomonas sp. N040 TaxID=2785325 RepID=UPI0018A2C4CB|nr:DUF2339 domain-containing protein [Pseudomonas sp. N040]MBF7729585.1 DUF2339 domain-containing protein [Pseudomonas sp. N040]MBW7013225.1 DUF2339 domain-containing protein [Pseudomonas sp. N040]
MDSRLLLALLGAVVGLAISEEALGLGIGAALGWLFAETRRQAAELQRLDLLISNTRPATRPKAVPAAPVSQPVTQAAGSLPPAGPDTELDWTLPDEVLNTAAASASVPPKAATQWIPPLPAAPRTEAAPDWSTRLIQAVSRFFTEGNPAVKIGLLLLFFGVAFLLRYASEHISVSLVWRLNGVAAAAAGLLGLGLWFVPRKRLYGLLLQGGGLGILYMTTFAALRLFHLLEPTPTFILLAALAALSAFLALRQDARVLASFGLAGGFLAPVLASTGEGNHIQLFSYYALLNVGLALIAWHRNWRELNLLGFTFTFVVGVIWGVTRYHAGLFHSVEPFLLLFCALYLMIGVRFALHQEGRQPAIDSTILFGTPLAFIGLQQPLVAPWEYGLAISSAIAAGVYAVLWWLLRQRAPLLLKDALAGTALVLGSLAIPLALSGDWTAVCWAAEGALVLHFGLRQQRHWSVLIALLLQFGAGLSLLFDTPSHPANWSDPRFWSALVLALCALFSAARLRLTPMRWRALEGPLLGWAALFWYGAWLWQVERLFEERPLVWAVVTTLALSGITWAALEARLNWRKLAFARFALPLLLAFCLAVNATQGAPLEGWGWLAWLLAIAGNSLLLRIGRDADNHLALRHALNLWLGLAVLAVQVDYWIGDWTAELNWNLAAQLLLAAALVRLLPRLQLAENIENAYHEWTPALLCGLGGLLWLAMLFPAPGASPFAWHLLFNPLDLPQLTALLVFWNWARQRLHTRADLLAAGAAFLLLNAIALRTLAINLNLPWDASQLFASDKVQTALAILWTLGGVSSMALSRRFTSRPLWIGGAVLLGLTVLKLFLVDLGNSGTLERIVSFIGVGLLLLIIGYIAPLPPATAEREAAEQ